MNVLDLDRFRFERQLQNEQPEIDGEEIMDYVYTRISFPLQEHIYEMIDNFFADAWNRMQTGETIIPSSLIQELGVELKNQGILLTESRTREVVELMLDFLSENGHADLYV